MSIAFLQEDLADLILRSYKTSTFLSITDKELVSFCDLKKNVLKEFKKFLKKKDTSFIRNEEKFFIEKTVLIEFLILNGNPQIKYSLCCLPFEMAKMTAKENEAIKSRSYVL